MKDLLHHSSKKRKDEANTSPQKMSVVTEPVHLTAMPLQNGDGHPLAGCRGGNHPPAKNKRQSHSATNQPSFIMQPFLISLAPNVHDKNSGYHFHRVFRLCRFRNSYRVPLQTFQNSLYSHRSHGQQSKNFKKIFNNCLLFVKS